jgi:hypothetical protein
LNSDDGHLYAFDSGGCGGDECPPDWTAALQADPEGEPQPPAVAEGIVYVGAGSTFYAFDANGCGAPECTPLWQTGTACTYFANYQNSPSVANGVVYSACASNHLYAFDAESGEILWSYNTSGGYPMRASPAIVNGRVYHAATFNFKLYAFEPPGPSTLHINKSKMNWAAAVRPGYYKLVFSARIHDDLHAPAPDATVFGTWTYPDGSTHDKTAVTDALGRAKFAAKEPQTGEYTFCIADIHKTGYVYDPDANQNPECRSVTVVP